MPALAIGSIDYGYPWWLSYGHLPILIAGLAIASLGYARKWSRGAMLFAGALILWSGAALLIERFVINVNGRSSLPTQSFLAAGAGRVLDMGAGTGRSSIMVLESRPQATLVALDLFGRHSTSTSDAARRRSKGCSRTSRPPVWISARPSRRLICGSCPLNPPPSMRSLAPTQSIT